MFSFTHIAIVMVIALLVFGPEKLPEVARHIGKALSDFRRASTDFRRVIEQEFSEIDRQAREKEEQARLKALEASNPAPVAAVAEAALEGGIKPPLQASNAAPGEPVAEAQSAPPATESAITAPAGSVANTTATDSGHISQENRSSHDVHPS